MGVSKNRGTPKSSILIGCSIINHPFWGTTIFGNTHIYIYIYCIIHIIGGCQKPWNLKLFFFNLQTFFLMKGRDSPPPKKNTFADSTVFCWVFRHGKKSILTLIGLVTIAIETNRTRMDDDRITIGHYIDSGKWRFIGIPEPKHETILVVTITGKGDNPNYIYLLPNKRIRSDFCCATFCLVLSWKTRRRRSWCGGISCRGPFPPVGHPKFVVR